MKSFKKIGFVLLALALFGAKVHAQESPLPEDLKKALSEKYKG